MAVETPQSPTLISVLEAQQTVLDRVVTPVAMDVRTADAAGYHLMEDISAPISLPTFDNSAMDGYAVDHRDLIHASLDHPQILNLAGEIPAGAQTLAKLKRGECWRIFTGAPIPSGATAIVMQEETRASSESIEFFTAPRPFEFVRCAGEDIEKGTVVMKRGEQITSRSMGLILALGIEYVPVAPRPRVAILSSGDELIRPGQPLLTGQVYESNSAMLAAMSRASGADVIIVGAANDSIPSLSIRLSLALQSADFILTSGGISVGKYDLIQEAWNHLGGSWISSKVNMKPGKPFSLGILGNHILMALPGNPVSAAMTWTLFALPALRKAFGCPSWHNPSQNVVCGEPLINQDRRTDFQRVILQPDHSVVSAGPQGSHRLSSLAGSTGFVELPPKSHFESGSTVRYTPWPQG
jgi:molybdopterin molybdotransferase